MDSDKYSYFALKQVRAGYGKQSDVLSDVSLEISENQIVSIVGASGAGKSTLLKAIAGIVPLRSGEVYLGERRIDKLPINRRNIGYVFQDYALFPNLNVFENLAFPLRAQKQQTDAEIEQSVKESAVFFEISNLLDRYPSSLSGGQRQRTALARAIISNPPLLLLDEALGAIDPILKNQIQNELLKIRSSMKVSIVYVTHDLDSAFAISDKIALLRNGSVEQCGTPAVMYEKPKSVYAANFFGDVNVFSGDIRNAPNGGAALFISDRQVDSSDLDDFTIGDAVDVIIRPSHLKLSQSTPSDFQLEGRVSEARFMRAAYFIEAKLSTGGKIRVQLQSNEDVQRVKVGTEVRLYVDPRRVTLISKETNP